MDILQQLLTLVERGSVEQRCASLLVLGALKLENSHILKTVGGALDDSNPLLKDYALRYFEEVQPKGGVPLLLRFLDDQDKEMRERAIRVLGRAGQAAVRPLLQRARTASRLW